MPRQIAIVTIAVVWAASVLSAGSARVLARAQQSGEKAVSSVTASFLDPL
ncbi:MAG TPA: hypothetical protein VFO34_13735 [Candidatus Acidoferrales bacterium]|nr:hypothetical protein [Candidatus Acidoferrales bacterium]